MATRLGRQHPDHTIAEELGIEARGDFYDQTGAMRDMVQNHLLQLLAIVAMEPPQSMDADTVSDEKLRVLRSLKPVVSGGVSRIAVRDQYQAGVMQAAPVSAYVTERGVRSDSRTGDLCRAKGGDRQLALGRRAFFLRTGKRLTERVAEIVAGEGMQLQSVHLDLAFDRFFLDERMDAYDACWM